MKNFGVFILIFSFFYTGYSQLFVLSNEARNAAVCILQSQNTTRFISDADIDTTLSYSLSIRGVNCNLLYEIVFSTGESVLLSGHKNCLPILAINTSSYRETILDNMESIPDGLKDLIDEYIEQIRIAFEKENTANSMEMQEQWQNLIDNNQDGILSYTEIIPPLLTTQWGQSYSNDGWDSYAYNYYVTESSTSCDKCATGCVATAMAQIMRYWNYPVFRYSETIQYDWCNMPDQLISYSSNYINEKQAIARLMRDCGLSVNMDYCQDGCGSGAASEDVRDALVDIFNYSSDADFQKRNSHNDNTWIGRIKNNLNNGWPVYYSGQNIGNHAFVCDGWKTGNLFHFNFGWRGSYYNNWFTLSSVTPGNYDFSSKQKAVFYIYPSTNESYCNFNLELWMHYALYYIGHTTPLPYNNVPKTATRLISSPIYVGTNYLDPSWRTIPTGATSEYVAHKEVVLQPGFTAASGSNFTARIEPCADCEATRELENPAIGERGNRGDASRGDAVHHVSTPDAAGLRLHPNPANTTLTVESDSPVREITIYDLTGRTMMTVENCSSPANVNVVPLPAGIYLLRAVTDNGVKTARFVKN